MITNTTGTNTMKFEELTDYQKNVAKSMGYMPIVSHRSNPEEALNESIEMLKRDGIEGTVAITAIYLFANSLLVNIAGQFKDIKDNEKR